MGRFRFTVKGVGAVVLVLVGGLWFGGLAGLARGQEGLMTVMGNENWRMEELPHVVRSDMPPPKIAAPSWLIVDFDSGWVIASENARARVEPASLVKLMTSYLVFEAIARGEIGLEERFAVSKEIPTFGSRMFLLPGERARVEDLLSGLIVHSGNDAAVALAVRVGGSEEEFVKRMNAKATELGMRDTFFVNSSGLPHPAQVSTAADMTRLARALIVDFPQQYRRYSQKEFTYAGITQRNRNRLLWRDASVDGVKTGFTENAGNCLIGSAKRGGVRWLVAVMGAKSEKQRADEVQALLEYGFAAYQGWVVYGAGEEIHALRLWKGEVGRAPVSAKEAVSILYPTGERGRLRAVLDAPMSLEAPLVKGQRVGEVAVLFDEEAIRRVDLQVGEDYPVAGWRVRLVDGVKGWLFRLGWIR